MKKACYPPGRRGKERRSRERGSFFIPFQTSKHSYQSSEVGVVCGYAFRSLDEEVGGSDQAAFFRYDVSLSKCQFLERSCDVDTVIALQKCLVCFLEILSYDKVIWIHPVISRLEQGRGERMLDRVSYEAEFHD